MTAPGLNGANDVGGIGNIGPIPIVRDEPVFREPWEAGVLAMSVCGVVDGTFTVDHHKAAAEELHPVAFMSMSYYEQWLYALETCLVDAGAMTTAEVEQRLAAFAADPDAPLPPGDNDELTEQVRALLTRGVPQPTLEREPRFRPGDRVRTRVIRVRPRHEHTSLPGYVQGRTGVIELVHRPEPLGDDIVAGAGMNLEYVYAVRFAAADLWPDARPGDTVVVDLFESYMEDAR